MQLFSAYAGIRSLVFTEENGFNCRLPQVNVYYMGIKIILASGYFQRYSVEHQEIMKDTIASE